MFCYFMYDLEEMSSGIKLRKMLWDVLLGLETG